MGYLTAQETAVREGTMSAVGLRCTAKGTKAFKDGIERVGLTEPRPATVEEAWGCLLAAAEPFSSFERKVLAAQGGLMDRGVYTSGTSIMEAMRLAHAAGFRWDPKTRRFRKPLISRLRGTLIVIAGALSTLLPLLFRSKETSLAEAVSSAATVAAVFVALYSVTRASPRP